MGHSPRHASCSCSHISQKIPRYQQTLSFWLALTSAKQYLGCLSTLEMSFNYWAAHKNAQQADQYGLAANVLSASGSLRAARLLQSLPFEQIDRFSQGREPSLLKAGPLSWPRPENTARSSTQDQLGQAAVNESPQNDATASLDCTMLPPSSSSRSNAHPLQRRDASSASKLTLQDSLSLHDYGLSLLGTGSNEELGPSAKPGATGAVAADDNRQRLSSTRPLEFEPSASQQSTPSLGVARSRRPRTSASSQVHHQPPPARNRIEAVSFGEPLQRLPRNVRNVYMALQGNDRVWTRTNGLASEVAGGAVSTDAFAYSRPIRAKIIELSGRELLSIVRTRAFVAGLLLWAGRAVRLNRARTKLLCLGNAILQRRSWLVARASIRIFALGLVASTIRFRLLWCARAKCFAIGVVSRAARLRADSFQRAAKGRGTRLHWNTNISGNQIAGSVFDRSGRRASVMLPGGSARLSSRPSLGLVLGADFVQKAAEEFHNARGKQKKATAKSPRQSKISFFSGTAARNYGIALTRCNSVQPFSQLAAAFLSMDVTKIKSKDLLETLDQLDIYSEAAAIRSVQQFQGDPAQLEIPDQFVYEVILKVPQTTDRIKALKFMVNQTSIVQQYQSVAGPLLQCSRTVRHSGALADVLGIMLRLGKEIQAATGGDPESVAGFKATSLCDLMKSKSRGGRSFGELLVEALLANAATIPNLSGELEPMMRTRVEVLTLNVLRQEISVMETAETLLEKLGPQLAGSAQAAVQEALRTGTTALRNLKKSLRSVSEEYDITCKFLLESPATSPATLFGALKKFVDVFSTELRTVSERLKRQSRPSSTETLSKSPSSGLIGASSSSRSISRALSQPTRQASVRSNEALPVPPSRRPAPPPKSAKHGCATATPATPGST